MAKENTVTIGEVRLSYVNLLVPRKIKDSAKEKYSCVVLISKKNSKAVDAVKAILTRLLEEEKAKYKGKLPAGYKKPLKDGDAVDPDTNAKVWGEECHGHYFINANADLKPGLVKHKAGTLVPLEENPDVVYSGMYGYASINFYPFAMDQNKGIGVSINHFLKTRDGERLGGRPGIDEAFADIEISDADLLGSAAEEHDDLLG